MKAYVWTPSHASDQTGDRLRLILDPAPRLQLDGETGWEDQEPLKWPRTLFAKLAEVLTEIEDLIDDKDVFDAYGILDQLLDRCFEVVEIEEEGE